jgi:LETM1 and EF-hand domain-containing protein 1
MGCRIEKELDDAERTIGLKMHVLDTDNDGIITRQELLAALQFLKDNMDDAGD